MADISKIKLPNGTTYDIKDAVARAKFPVAVTDGGTGRTSALEGFWNLENRGYNTDANAALSVGLYNTNTSTQNLPSPAYSQGNGRGILLVYVSNASTHNNLNNWIWQMWLNTTTTELFIRKKVNTGSWGEWYTSLDTIRSHQYYEAATPAYGINLNNSDIIGVNSIYTNDFADNAKEGIQFLRSATTADSLWARNGTLYFTPNRTLGQSTGPQGDLPLYTVPWYGTGTRDLSIRPYVAFARANRFAFLPASQVIIEETTDGGQTWTSGNYSDAQKKALFATRSASIRIPLLNGAKSTDCGVRITITGMKYNVPENTTETEKYNYWNSTYVNSQERYFNLREMWFWLSANNDTIRCQVYRATGAKPNEWQTSFDMDFGMTGWSGSDWIRFDGNWTYGGSTSQPDNFWNWRIIFWSRMPDGKTSFQSAYQQAINGINGYGDSVWSASNGLMYEDHLYMWDTDMNAAFPAQVQAPTFKGIGTELTALNGSNITTGTVAEARIAVLPASKITSGTFDTARIPNLDAGKITTGTFDTERLPIMTGATKESNGTSGIVPAPTINDKNYFLKGDGTWSSLMAPLDTRTYTDVIATANNNRGGGFFYLKVRGDTYNTKWYVKTRVFATVPGQELYETDTIFELWGYANTYSGYACMNKIKSTSYRPIYYNSYFGVSATGYDNDCGGWIGFNLIFATNNTNASYKRNIIVELLDYQNCEVELQDNLITPDNIPNRAANTSWYTSTNTSFNDFDAATQGLKQCGDSNTVNISNLYYYSGNYVANSPIYRYQLLFHIDDDKLTPLNNDNNVIGITKTMLTDIEIYPFKDILYYNTTTNLNINANISAATLLYSFSGIDLRYTFNITTSTLTSHKNVYLVLTPTTNNKAKLASANPLTQDLPDNDDGYWYLLLGRAYSGYQMSLYPKHPIYAYKNGKIVIITPSNIELYGYKKLQSSVPDPVSSGNEATLFISNITQNEEGVITPVKANLPEASINKAGIVQLNNATDSTSTDTAATASAVKTAYDLAASKTNNTGTVTSITLTSGEGISINDSSAITTSGIRTITNSGVRSISQGATNGTISVNTNGTISEIAVKGLGTAAYTSSSAYATAEQGTKADNAMPKSGGTFTGNIVLAADPISNLHPATKQYVDNNVSISGTLATGTQIGIININGNSTTLYTPNEAPMTVQVTQSTTTPTAEFIISTNTKSSASLTGVLGSTTAIANGKIIYYMTKYELPASEVTLTLRYASSSNYTAAIPIYSYGTTRSVTPYPASYILTLVYYNNAFYLASNNIAIAI